MDQKNFPMRLTGSVIDRRNPAVKLQDDGGFDLSGFPHWDALMSDTAKGHIATTAHSVCRIMLHYVEDAQHKTGYGTGFVVGAGLIATNKHVVEKIYALLGDGKYVAVSGYSGHVSFAADGKFADEWPLEKAVCFGFPIRFSGIFDDTPFWDIALVRVPEAATAGRTPLRFAVTGASPTQRNVAAIGYPTAYDNNGSGTEKENIALGATNTSGFDPVKRLSPGVLGSFGEHHEFGLRHSCSTLRGSSGSPLIDLDNGLVLAVHYFGDNDIQAVDENRSNWAVPSNQLGEFIAECDKRLAGTGTILTGNLAKAKRASLEDATDFFGVLPDPPDFRDLDYRPSLRELRSQEELPVDYPPTVLNQRDEPSCTAFALAHLLAVLQRHGSDAKQVSTRMAYEMARLHDDVPGRTTAGSTLRGVIKGFFHNGLATTDDREWGTDRKTWDYTFEVAKNARSLSLGAYYRLSPNLSDYHSAIAETGAILVSARVHMGWEIPKDGRITFPAGQTSANHAFVIVGYDSEGFIVLNSFGREWSTWKNGPGRAHWSYEDWAENILDGWVLRPAVSAPNAFGKTARIAFGNAQGGVQGSKNPSPRRSDVIGHSITTEHGDLMDYGRFASNLLTLRETATIFDSCTPNGDRKYKHLLLFAHSELTREDAAQSWVAATKPFFKRNGIYPVSILIEPAYAVAFRTHFDGVVAEARQRLPESAPGFAALVQRRLKVFGPKIWKSHEEAISHALRKKSTTYGGLVSLLEGAKKAELCIHLAGHSRGALVVEKLADIIQTQHLSLASVQLLGPAVGHLGVAKVPAALAACGKTLRRDYVFKRSRPNDNAKPDLKQAWLELVEACFMGAEGFVVGLAPAAFVFRQGPNCNVTLASDLVPHGLTQMNCCAKPRVVNELARIILAGQPLKNQLDESSLSMLDFDS